MGWLSKLVGFENSFTKNLVGDIFNNPTRLITGIDPGSTKVWNAVTGSDNKPLVNWVGGPDDQYFQRAEQEGIDTGPARGFHTVADTIAGIFGANGAAGALGKAAGSLGGAFGSGAGGSTGAGGGLSSIFGGGSAGSSGFGFNPSTIGSIGKVLGAITDYQNNKQNKEAYQNLVTQLGSMYAPGSPEEAALRQRIEAQDAAAGRRSQYGPREINLAGEIAKQKANIMTNPTYGSYMNAITGANANSYNSLLAGLGGMFGSGGSANGTSNSFLNGLGNLFGGNSNNGSNIQLDDNWMEQGKNLANSLFGG